MDLGKIQRLQQQAAIARSANLQANTHKAKLPDQPSGVASSYDADSGLDIIRLSDGSIQYALPDTSGVRSPGDSLVVRTGGGMTHVDARPSKRNVPISAKRKLLEKPELHTFKVLFSVVEGDIQKFYIGGDRPEPLLIYEIDTTIYYGTTPLDPSVPDYDLYIGGFISNTGAKKDDWIVGIRYSVDRPENPKFNASGPGGIADNVHLLTIITPSSTTTFSDENDTELGIGTLGFKGAGIWMTRADLALNLTYYTFADLIGLQLTEEFITLFEQTTVRPPGTTEILPKLDVVNPLPWYPVTTPRPSPFLNGDSYIFDKNDHDGLRAIPAQYQFSTLDQWNFLRKNNNAFIYAAGSDSYQAGQIFVDPSSRIYELNRTSHLDGRNNNAYLVAEGSSYLKDGGSYANGLETGGGSSYFKYVNATRKNLIINKASISVMPSFELNYTNLNYYGYSYRQNSTQAKPTLNIRRFIRLLDCSGTTYLLPNIAATSKSTSFAPYDRRITQQSDSGLSINYEQDYIESIAIDCNQKGCLVKSCQTTITDDGSIYYPLEPTTIEYLIYDKSTDSMKPILALEQSFSFNHATDTFIGLDGYQKISLDNTILTEIKIESKTVTTLVQKYIQNGDSYTIENLDGQSIKIESLNIDIANQHYIHNLSYF